MAKDYLSPAVQRKGFMVLIGLGAVSMISFTRGFAEKLIGYNIWGSLTVGTVIGIVLLYGLKKYYDRDL